MKAKDINHLHQIHPKSTANPIFLPSCREIGIDYIRADEGNSLSDIIRDFKKFTAKEVIKAIKEEPESRKEWIPGRMEFRGNQVKRVKQYKFRKDDNRAIVLRSPGFTRQKLEYIHQNPVKAMIVEEPQHYVFSSAIDYADSKGQVDVELKFG